MRRNKSCLTFEEHVKFGKILKSFERDLNSFQEKIEEKYPKMSRPRLIIPRFAKLLLKTQEDMEMAMNEEHKNISMSRRVNVYF